MTISEIIKNTCKFYQSCLDGTDEDGNDISSECPPMSPQKALATTLEILSNDEFYGLIIIEREELVSINRQIHSILNPNEE